MRFSGEVTYSEKLSLQNYQDTNDDKGTYSTTLTTWIYREDLSSTKGQASIQSDGSIKGRPDNLFMADQGADEVLFDHEGIMTLVFQEKSSDYLTVYNFNDAATERSIRIKIPRG